MLELVLGIGAAAGASAFYSVGIALQALDAKEAPHEEHLRLALARNLVSRARWLAGTGLSILGWPLQIVALLLAPLVVVQPALAAGLLVLMFFAQRMLGERAGRYEYLTMCAIVVGVIGAVNPFDFGLAEEALGRRVIPAVPFSALLHTIAVIGEQLDPCRIAPISASP